MPGAIVDIVARNIEDVCLTGDPEITFFKTVYRRYTNFASEIIEQKFSTTPGFGNTVTCTLGRQADLLSKIFVAVHLPAVVSTNNLSQLAYVRSLGTALISDVSFIIDNTVIDRQYGEWLRIWYDFTVQNTDSLNKMIGDVPELYQVSSSKPAYQLYIPLGFWFCKYNGMALPIIALGDSVIKIVVKFSTFDKCVIRTPTHSLAIEPTIPLFIPGEQIYQKDYDKVANARYHDYNYLTSQIYYNREGNLPLGTTDSNIGLSVITTNPLRARSFSLPTARPIYDKLGSYVTPAPNAMEEPVALIPEFNFTNASLLVNYVYLDKTERTRFQTSHIEYLIEQTQRTELVNSTTAKISMILPFKNLIKEFFWVVQKNNEIDPQEEYIIPTTAQILLNGIARTPELPGSYYVNTVPFLHHYPNIPKNNKISVWTPSITPVLHQPSSTINGSMFESIDLSLTLPTSEPVSIRSYAVNYNILRIFARRAVVLF